MNMEDEEMTLKLLHTADWHLGLTHPAFDAESETKLTRARFDVVERILGEAETLQVHAVLVAGDIFDTPQPEKQWWDTLLKKLHERSWTDRRMFLLPGNHDPLNAQSPYDPDHPFRRGLPAWAQVVDQDNQAFPLTDDAVLYASPCRSTAGSNDLAAALPPREDGDPKLRIAMLHGQTSGFAGQISNFPITAESAAERGFDYLALGDIHEYQLVADDPPVVYPGTPEPARMGEEGGQVVVVMFRRSGGAPIVRQRRVGQWRWKTVQCDRMSDLRAAKTIDGLEKTVLRLRLDFEASVAELEEVERILEELQGTVATRGLVGVLQVDRSQLRQAAPTDEFTNDLPDLFRKALDRINASDAPPEVQNQAIAHLYKLLKNNEGPTCV